MKVRHPPRRLTKTTHHKDPPSRDGRRARQYDRGLAGPTGSAPDMTDGRRVGPCLAACFQRELADPSGQLTLGAVDVTLPPFLGPLLAEPRWLSRKPRSDGRDGPVRSRVRRPVALRTQGASYRSKSVPVSEVRGVRQRRKGGMLPNRPDRAVGLRWLMEAGVVSIEGMQFARDEGLPPCSGRARPGRHQCSQGTWGIHGCLAQSRRTSSFAWRCRWVHYGPMAVADPAFERALGPARGGALRAVPSRGSCTRPGAAPVTSPHGHVDPQLLVDGRPARTQRGCS